MALNTLAASQVYKSLWASHETSATALLTLCLDEFGQEGLDGDPLALVEDIKTSFSVGDVPQVNLDKIMSLWTSLTTDLVHTDPSTFIQACNALNGTPISFDIFDPADPYECAWALTELSLLDSEAINNLSPSVRRYIGEAYKEAGIIKIPTIIQKAADFGEDDYFELAALQAEKIEDSAVYLANQEAYREELDKYVEGRLRSLFHELNILPLQNRSENWAKFYKDMEQKLPSLQLYSGA
jgi:hypothetical protein